MSRLLAICILTTAATLTAAPIGFTFRTAPSSIATDLDGNGTEETIAYLSTATNQTWWIMPPDAAQLQRPDQDRYFFFRQPITIENMYLDPIGVAYNCDSGIGGNSCYAYDRIGFTFDENVWFQMSSTYIRNGKRIDQTARVYWSNQYSNDIISKIHQGAPGTYYPYVAEMDLFATLMNLKEDERQFYFQFQTVWSNPNTYFYEKHSTWSGYGTITDVFRQRPSAVPEPSAALLCIPALFGLIALRRYRRA